MEQKYTLLNGSALAMSVVTNLLATLFIAYKLWYANVLCMFIINIYMTNRAHQKFIHNLGLAKRQSPVQNVLILLVESGTIYLGFQVSFLWLIPSIYQPMVHYAVVDRLGD